MRKGKIGLAKNIVAIYSVFRINDQKQMKGNSIKKLLETYENRTTSICNPLRSFPPCLVKKETFNGIIGKTQSVKSAINPPKNPKTKWSTVPIFHLRTLSSSVISKSLFFRSSLVHCSMSRLVGLRFCSATTTSSPVKEI